MRGGSLTRYTPPQVGDGLWKTLLEIGAPAVAEGLESLAQGKALDAAAGTVLRAGVSGLKRKASQSVRSTMQKQLNELGITSNQRSVKQPIMCGMFWVCDVDQSKNKKGIWTNQRQEKLYKRDNFIP